MKFGIAGNLEKEELPQVVEKLVRRFEKDGIPYVIHDELARAVRRKLKSRVIASSTTVRESKLAESCEILIALGGDGTILRMARLVGAKGTPILGINLGKLGFLAEVSINELDECLTRLMRGDYLLEDRMMLEAFGVNGKKPCYALNDIVVDKSGSSRVIDIETYVNDEYLATFTADGIILSTPTGSTAYALSNGGPILTPTNRAIMISPICPHTLTARPVIVPDESTISLKILQAPSKVHFTADGQLEKFITPPVQVVVKKAAFSARLVKSRNTSYYDVLRKKLHWARDVRLKESSQLF